MGRIVDMPLPRLGETMEEGRIVAWLKQPGEAFRRGETLLEVETDKTVVEVPALQDGILREQSVRIDDRIAIDAPIAKIEIDGELVAAAAAETERSTPVITPARVDLLSGDRVPASTAARRFARRNGVALSGVTGTGRRGRVSLSDLKPVTVPSHVIVRGGHIALRDWPPQGARRGTAVLLHGLFADTESWSVFARVLARHGIHAIAADLPAHGASDAAFATLEDVEQSVLEAIAATVSGPLILIGHSFGGFLAARLAPRLGSRLKELLLISPGGFGPNTAHGFINAVLNADSLASTRAAMDWLGAGPASKAVVQDLADKVARRRGELARIAGFLDGADVLDGLAALEAPVTAVFSRDDRIVPAGNALNAPQNVSIRIVSGHGHVPHWFRADYLAGLLKS